MPRWRKYSTRVQRTGRVTRGRWRLRGYKEKGKYGNKKQRTKTNKQLTRAVKKLWKAHAVKQHYVIDTGTTAVATPRVMALTGIGQGEDEDQHEGDKIQLRSLHVHGYTKVVNAGATPSISHPTRWNVMVVRTSKVGVGSTPDYTNIFDATNLPADMALFDGFRQLGVETLSQLKILYKKSFTLAPQSNDGATGYTSPYPGFKSWTLNLKLGNAMIEYRDASSIPINAQYFIMLTSNSTGAAGNLGLQHSFVSKLTFRDVE